MNTCVVMPFRGSEQRFRLASWVRMRFGALHPEWRFVAAVDGGEPWTKARAVNHGIPASADIVIVTDADVAVPAKALDWSVQQVRDGAAWAVPYSVVYRLREGTTAEVLSHWPVDIDPTEMAAADCARPPYEAVPGGGIFVVARDAWETVRGLDERFQFGQEDAPLGHALDTLAGPHVQLPAPLWHLWHCPRDPHGRGHELANDMRLENRYHGARGNVEAMRRLIRERGAGPAVAARERSTTQA